MPPRTQPASPMSGEELKQYLNTQDDFALELEVYRHALGLGFKASHAGLYDDPITNKRRQYDVRASFELPNLVNSLYLTIECKALDPIYPLLVQRVARPGNESFHQVMLSRNSTTRYGIAREPVNWPGAGLFSISGTRMYDSGQQVGKSMKRVKRADQPGSFSATDSDIYEKYTQALTSMYQVAQDCAVSLRPQLAAPGLARAFLPIVVVSDGALWVADYSASAQLTGDPRQVDETEFYLGWNYEIDHPQFSNFSATFTISHLHIMTRSRLPRFLEEISAGGDIWLRLFGSL